MTDKRHSSGHRSELYVASVLAGKGYTISFPLLTQSKYDLVMEYEGKFWSVQVKTATPSRAGAHLYLQARLSRDKGRATSEVDYYAFTDGDTVWLVPSEELKGMTSICLDSSNPEYKPYKKYNSSVWRL